MNSVTSSSDSSPSSLTWSGITRLEPRLILLERRVLSGRLPEDDARFWSRWNAFNRELSTLVGWSATDGHPALQNTAAYDVAHRQLLERYEIGGETP